MTMLRVSETFLFDQAKWDGLGLKNAQKTAIGGLRPLMVRLIDGAHCLLTTSGGHYFFGDRQLYDAFLGAIATKDEPGFGVRGIRLDDFCGTPAPSFSVPVDANQLINADQWIDANNRLAAAAAWGVTPL